MRTLTLLLLLIPWTVGGALASTIDMSLPAIEPGCPLPTVESPQAGCPRWRGPDGEPLPFRDDAEVMEFLRAADVVSAKQLGKGINRPLKVLLERDGLQAHAVFRRVSADIASYRPPGSTHVPSFRDSFLFEPAAYKLGRLLGVRNIPPVALRRYDGHDGTIQLWIEDSFDEEKRLERGWSPPDPDGWQRQRNVRRVFDALIHNIDRNRGNVLYDTDWYPWLIDHTRSFVAETDLADGREIRRCDSDLWQRLKTVDRQVAAAAVEPYLTRPELRALMIRWQKLVEHFEGLIEEHGEGSVLF